MADQSPVRVLGIDPSSRNVAFVVLEGPGSLVDWGSRTTQRADSARAQAVIEALIERFQPQVVAIEDYRSRGARRCPRVRKLLDDVESSVPATVTVRRVAFGQVALLTGDPSVNKYERAHKLAERYPELRPRLPRFRKPWMSEDERVNLFDALAFALACFLSEPEKVENPLFPV